ncbi:type II toxin-antitoxin system HicB family antitoxin [Larkinella sp. VNQ87]|uniref:type II toxin-antitoxin system HicB family antitoxin n=1 Tax=Larkinella sp. VNQ87 TaxID=3400921 RepID=UPI003C10F274
MIGEYLQSALRKAHYELEEGTFYAEIPGFEGVIAYGDTLEACREQLLDVLEGWLIVGIRHGHKLPIVEGIDLNPALEVV